MNFVTVDEIARRFSVTPGIITAWRHRLGLQYRRMSKGRCGGFVLFTLEEVEAWANMFKKSDLRDRFIGLK